MATKLPPQPLGVAPGSSYWNDWYEKLRTFVDQITTSVDWTIITNKPTTLVGYGIGTTGTGLAVAQNTPTLITPVIGVATGTSLALTGGITTGDTNLHTTTTTLTNAAGAAAGTLGNAPTVGNPSKWVQINDNGVIRKIPTWL